MMSESLRMRVVEAGARALDDEIGGEMREHLAHILRKWPNTIPETAEVVLDAMLDCLTENADEWSDLEEKLHTGEPFGASWHNSHADELRHLVTVLREDR